MTQGFRESRGQVTGSRDILRRNSEPQGSLRTQRRQQGVARWQDRFTRAAGVTDSPSNLSSIPIIRCCSPRLQLKVDQAWQKTSVAPLGSNGSSALACLLEPTAITIHPSTFIQASTMQPYTASVKSLKRRPGVPGSWRPRTKRSHDLKPAGISLAKPKTNFFYLVIYI